MKWLRYRPASPDHAVPPHLGVVVGDVVHGAGADLSILGLIASGSLGELGKRLFDSPEETVPLTDVIVTAPIQTPPSIRDFMAFEQHVEAMGRLVGATPYVPEVWHRQPLYYFSNPASLVGPYDDVAVPPGCDMFDFELEVAAVVGPAPGLPSLGDLTVAEAARCIVGYTLMNDWTARDLQAVEMQGPLGPCKGKDSAIGLGPWLLTTDEVPGLATGEPSGIVLEASVDGAVLGRDSLDSMAWSFAELISYASRGTRLQAGDVIGSGTCGDGCIAERWGRSGRDSFDPLRPGSVVTLDGGPLGRQQSRVLPAVAIREPLRDRRRSRAC
jgi:2-keto-4-pentenoate hydratase/2-oxohepta-3-ene-1,7-dioic acid hydratase in catechol pathway